MGEADASNTAGGGASDASSLRVSRRTLVRGAAWAAPAIALASAAPAYAISTACVNKNPNFQVTTGMVTGWDVANVSGANVPGIRLNPSRTLTMTSTFTNPAGSGVTIPAGAAVIQLMAPYWAQDVSGNAGYVWNSITGLTVSAGWSLTAAGIDQWTINNPYPNNSEWNGFNYAVNQAMPPGSSFTVTWTVTAYPDAAGQRLQFWDKSCGTSSFYMQTYTLAKISVAQCNAGSARYEKQVGGPTFALLPRSC